MKYEDRYLALLDILGFSAWILSDNQGSGAAKLADIYKEIRGALKPYRGRRGAGWITLTLFSDTIVVSTKASSDPRSEAPIVSEFLWCVRRIALILLKHGFILLKHGFLARGCIVRDEVAHNDDVVVGPAIIAAHRYESRVARYPRILVVRKLRDEVERQEQLTSLLCKSADGPRHLHVLHEFEKFFAGVSNIGEKRARGEAIYTFATEARAALHRSLAQCTDDPEHFEKVKWFADYFNASVIDPYKTTSSLWIKRIDLESYF